ncbi:MAG: RNA methyltransferase [Ruminococcus sp.]|nr:RNA methyltransferase [Ruminococcus sp.]
MFISSRDNPRIKRLHKLMTSRKARLEAREFVVEGMRSCIDAAWSFRNGISLDISGVYFVKEAVNSFSDRLDVSALYELPEELLFEITQEIADKLSDTETSQGIFMTAKAVDISLTEEAIKPDGKYLILDGLQDPGNLGTIIRTSDAVGVDGVVLTGNCVDLYNPKVVRSTMGSLARVPIFVENNKAKVFDTFENRKIRTCAAVVSNGKKITDFDFCQGCAVVIGNEGRGLDQSTVDLCDDRVSIKMHGNIESLNAASAATIFLWEMTRGTK